jgi:hypothetical protein
MRECKPVGDGIGVNVEDVHGLLVGRFKLDWVEKGMGLKEDQSE